MKVITMMDLGTQEVTVNLSPDEVIAAITSSELSEEAALREITSNVLTFYSRVSDKSIQKLKEGLREIIGQHFLKQSTRFWPEGSTEAKVRAWVIKVLGENAMVPWARGIRFLEEALELVQPSGVTKEQALLLVDSVYDKPDGELRQELGGAAVTLYGLAAAWNYSVSEALERELLRIDSLPPERFQQREIRNHAAGIGVLPDVRPEEKAS